MVAAVGGHVTQILASLQAAPSHLAAKSTELQAQILASPTVDDSALHGIAAWADQHPIWATLASLTVLLTGRNFVLRSLPSTAGKEQRALALMTDSKSPYASLAPIANVLKSAESANARLVINGGRNPAHSFMRGAELVISGPREAQEAVLLDLVAAVTGKRFDSIKALHQGFDFTGALPRGIPYLHLTPEEPGKQRVTLARGQNEVVIPPLVDPSRPQVDEMNPPGYAFVVGAHRCMVRATENGLSVQLSRRAPLDRDIKPRGTNYVLSGKGPLGKTHTPARVAVQLPTTMPATA